MIHKDFNTLYVSKYRGSPIVIWVPEQSLIDAVVNDGFSVLIVGIYPLGYIDVIQIRGPVDIRGSNFREAVQEDVLHVFFTV